MKKFFSIFNFALFIGLLIMTNSCSQEEMLGILEQETGEWHSAKVRFNINCVAFDQGSDGTRASSNAWKDGDMVYLLLTGKDGNKVKAYVTYNETKDDWGEIMYDGYKNNLTCTTERVAEAYFLEGIKNIEDTLLVLSNKNAAYACTTGSYVFPEDGVMTVKVSLTPQTGRIRFVGDAGPISVSGVKTHSTFSRNTGDFTSSTNTVSTTVETNGSSPYIYCVFADTQKPYLTIVTDNTYRTVFDPTSSVLKPGKSGFLKLPTNADHRGWVIYQPVTSITLDKTEIYLPPGSGNTAQLTATILPENASDKSVTWSSSNPQVATVDADGRITAGSEGVAIITAQSVDNSSEKATCEVSVGDGRIFTVSGVTFRMKLVEKGTFYMGSDNGEPNEKPVHKVTLTKDYYIGETEVTQALWKAVTGDAPTFGGPAWNEEYGLGDKYPAYHISYKDVQSFITKLNALTKQNFRMPTEAEWEFAARGGIKGNGTNEYSGSHIIDDVAWYKSESIEIEKAQLVRQKKANELGLYDMSGNVYEWCSDWYAAYDGSEEHDPTGPTTDQTNRVLRGGSWRSSHSSCRCTTRNMNVETFCSDFVGFRLALY